MTPSFLCLSSKPHVSQHAIFTVYNTNSTSSMRPKSNAVLRTSAAQGLDFPSG